MAELACHTAGTIRPYLITDHVACLSLSESNFPKYFLASERADHETFLGQVEREPLSYFALERGNETLACGGVSREWSTLAQLS